MGFWPPKTQFPTFTSRVLCRGFPGTRWARSSTLRSKRELDISTPLKERFPHAISVTAIAATPTRFLMIWQPLEEVCMKKWKSAENDELLLDNRLQFDRTRLFFRFFGRF